MITQEEIEALGFSTVTGSAMLQALVSTLQNSGSVDQANTTLEPPAGGDFTGEWIQSDAEHIGWNCLSNVDGSLFVEFSLDGSAALQTLTKKYEIIAGEPDFDAFVKLPGRYHRVRFESDAAAPTVFGLLTALGDNLYPYLRSDRDTPYFLAYGFSGVTATTHYAMVDLSDRANYPHRQRGRIDLYGTFFSSRVAGNASGAIQLGVITRIDETSADVAYVQGSSVEASEARSVSRDRDWENPIRLGQAGGNLTRVAVAKTTGITAINTATPLPGLYGDVTAAVGDLVLTVTRTSGTINGFASIQYLTEANPA